ncbi:MAG: dynein regulatory complex subunit 6-like isoform, partial [Planctomycetaceae bacterium]|nr:dynein regulatory complex subunit 6-like isoform [Planctomycetaceae bacterium]
PGPAAAANQPVQPAPIGVPGPGPTAPAQVDNAQAIAAFIKKTKTDRLNELDLNEFAKVEGTEGLDEIHDLKLAGVMDTGLVHLSRFTKVTSLTLEGCTVTNAVGAVIQGLPELRILNLNSNPIDDQVMAVIASKPSIVELRLANTGLTDLGLNELEKLHDLEILDVSGTNITGAGFERFRDHKKLRALYANRCRQLQSEAFKFLAGCPLETLEVNATAVSDPGMVFIGKLKKLKKLSIGECGISDFGINKLVGMKDLEYIDVHNLVVSKALFQKLAPCKKLTYVNVRGTGISPADCVKFKTSHPECQIVR